MGQGTVESSRSTSGARAPEHGGAVAHTVAVAGASGYAGGELLRLLSGHPDVDIQTMTAHSQAGARVSDVHPHLASLGERSFETTDPALLAQADVVFFALPHGQSAELAAQVAELNPDALLVDCGADHRLESPADWEQFYGGDHPGTWTYGVPELPFGTTRQRSRLPGSKRVAAPGCNASTVALGLAPGVRDGLIDPSDIVATLAVGPSGAGRALKPHLLASELLGNARPYSVAGTHRHIPEIKQALGWAKEAGEPGPLNFGLAFTPVLVPVPRGILAVISVPFVGSPSLEQLHKAWADWYRDEPFVRVLPAGEVPQLSSVLGSNRVDIGIAKDEPAGRALIVVAVDNLVKGTAGAAIQSMNLALGLPESAGLETNGVAP